MKKIREIKKKRTLSQLGVPPSRQSQVKAGEVDKMNYSFTSSMFHQKAPLRKDWEAQPLNDRDYYLDSPVAKFSKQRGDFSEEKFLSRTFNRRLRMRDTFTSVNPLYKHEKKTCYIPPYSHFVHPKFKRDIQGRPMKHVPRDYNHKMDEIKVYNEEMLKLRDFAPPPRKAIKP